MSWGKTAEILGDGAREQIARENMAVQAQYQRVKVNEVVDFLLSPHSLPTFDHFSDLIADKSLIRVMAFFSKILKYLKLDLSDISIISEKKEGGKALGLKGEAKIVINEDFFSSLQERMSTEIRADLNQVIDVQALQSEKQSRTEFFNQYGLDNSQAHGITETPVPSRYEPQQYPPPYGGNSYGSNYQQGYQQQGYGPPPQQGSGTGGRIISSLLSNL